MAHDPTDRPETAPTDPSTHAPAEPTSALPGFLGSTAPTPLTPKAGPDTSAHGIRIVLMSLAILVTAFYLYREFTRGAGAGGGTTTEYAWRVLDPDGSPVDLASYRGRPVLLNVWATWCGPCMMEMPSLIALSRRPELKEAGVAVVLVSTDYDLEPVRGFLSRTDVGDADVLVAADRPPREFSTAGIPATFLIDPDGRIVRGEVGAMDWNTPEIAAELVSLARGR